QVLLAELFALGQERRRAELAVEPVRPRVVRAPDGALEPPRRYRLVAGPGLVRDPQRQPAATVPAHVVERMQRAILRPDHQDALAQHVQGEEVTRVGYLPLAACAEPFPGEQALPLRLEGLGRAVRLG